MLRIGAVAYAPSVVTIFEGLKRHFHRQGIELDWVLYSNYDALVTAFVTGEVDLAWNGPLAYVKIRRALAEPCRVVAMRDIDVGFTTQFITQRESSIQQIADLRGKRFAFGRRSSVQAGLLAYHYLKEAGLVPDRARGERGLAHVQAAAGLRRRGQGADGGRYHGVGGGPRAPSTRRNNSVSSFAPGAASRWAG